MNPIGDSHPFLPQVCTKIDTFGKGWSFKSVRFNPPICICGPSCKQLHLPSFKLPQVHHLLQPNQASHVRGDLSSNPRGTSNFSPFDGQRHQNTSQARSIECIVWNHRSNFDLAPLGFRPFFYHTNVCLADVHPVLLITCHLSYESTVLKVFKSCVHSLTPCLSHWEVNCGQSSVASARTGQKDLQHCLSDIYMMDTQNASSDQQGLAALHPPCSTFASRSKPHCLAIIPNHSPVQLWMFHDVSYVS